MTSNRFFDRAFAAAAVVLAACGSEATRVATQTIDAPVEMARSELLAESRIVTGSVRSATVSPIAAKVLGNVVRVLVVEGQHVNSGDLLIEIDDREGSARMAQAGGMAAEVEEAIGAARANAKVMAATYERFAALRGRGSVSPQEFDEVAAKNGAAQAQLAQALARRTQARAGAAEAETFQSYSRVRSPIAGVVTARMIDPGGQAAPGIPLLTIEDDAHYRVETTVDDSLAGAIHAGGAVTIDGRIAARITTVVPAFDPVTRSAVVKIDLPGNTGLRSGTFVRVAFTIGSRRGVTVPAAAVARRGQLTSVFVLDKERIARMRLVTLGEVNGDRVEVLSGIDAGESVVLRNDVREGTHVVSSRASARDLGGWVAPKQPYRAARTPRSLATLGMTGIGATS